jgi:hypothetical protein
MKRWPPFGKGGFFESSVFVVEVRESSLFERALEEGRAATGSAGASGALL